MGNVITIGADPEFFIVDKAQQPVASVGKFGGTKEKPVRISESLSARYTVQEDNVAVEFNIPPSKSMGGFVQSIQAALHSLNDKVSKMGYAISAQPEMVFPYSQLKSVQAQTFGCSPDFNAHDSGEVFPRINQKELRRGDGELRMAGAHVHVGFKSDVPPFVAASFADVFMGLRSIGNDVQKERRKYYGQPGRFRPTSYGIEYRTLSNYWLFDHGAMCDIGTSAIMLGTFLQDTAVDKIRKTYQGIPWTSVQEAIKTDNHGLAATLRNYLTTEFGLEV